MLPPTRQAVSELIESGLTRNQFRVRTRWERGTNSYGETTIVLLCSYMQIAANVQKLAEHFKVVVTLLDGIPCDVFLKSAETPGLYRVENGQEIEVSQIEYKGEYQQLSLWDYL